MMEKETGLKMIKEQIRNTSEYANKNCPCLEIVLQRPLLTLYEKVLEAGDDA
jgi:hypothetical protein